MTSPTIYLNQRIKKRVNKNSVVYHIIDDGLIQEFNTLKGAQEFVAYLDQLKTEREESLSYEGLDGRVLGTPKGMTIT